MILNGCGIVTSTIRMSKHLQDLLKICPGWNFDLTMAQTPPPRLFRLSDLNKVKLLLFTIEKSSNLSVSQVSVSSIISNLSVPINSFKNRRLLFKLLMLPYKKLSVNKFLKMDKEEGGANS